MSHRYHLPPSVHTTFVAPRFVICTFVPRPFETDPGALKVPFFHNNDDYDEVIFYHAGDFFSRDNIRPGMMTLHPGGFTHGPHPQALKNMLKQPKAATDEYAVMLDARDPLGIMKAARHVEWEGYVDSWKSFMKLATVRNGTRDGQLVIVSRDLAPRGGRCQESGRCRRRSTTGWPRRRRSKTSRRSWSRAGRRAASRSTRCRRWRRCRAPITGWTARPT